jgi:hypothetical protein
MSPIPNFKEIHPVGAAMIYVAITQVIGAFGENAKAADKRES